MLDRLQWRVQPIDQIRKRQQRKRDMWERHEKFAEYVERVKRKKAQEWLTKNKFKVGFDE